MKKLGFVALATMLVFSMVSCGSSDNNKKTGRKGSCPSCKVELSKNL